MATLKLISMRLKSVKSIQKITKSMKMVSAAKFARAERELAPARIFGVGARSLYEVTDLASEEREKKKFLAILVSSDRGLCGGIHSNVAKSIRADLNGELENYDTKLVIIGDKVKSMMQGKHGSKIVLSVNDYGKKVPLFEDASRLAEEVIASGVEYDIGAVYYNNFKSVISYNTSKIPIFPVDALESSEKLSVYDDIDNDVLQCYHEFSLASLIFYTMKEGACSEQSSRMTAMEAATKNAGEMIDRLTLRYNRTRQAVITKELIEIISGAAAIK
ncbi:ATP synthase subunit gamma, mitochondrial-like [Oopsacas minuta]|uniref:ATP synthase subunit gamma n=1 Tax=Oopsacas minuta TaxID=111878 RepID=A0AAV7JVN9_9METZ|nr:ATP synthase subunit gamma, mitochondrial-like [Oopsacas minuta]